jgi:hypothetical protein
MHLNRLKTLVGSEISDLLGFWSGALKTSLGDNLIGAYLTGSLTYGDFIDGRSDIDLAAVMKQPLSATELERIRQVHVGLEQQFLRWKQKIECSYIPIELLPCVLPPKMPRPWWGFGVLYETAPYGNEWIINQYFLWKCSLALIGPEFKDLVHHVDIKDVQKACAQDLFQEWVPKIDDPEWLANGHYQSYLVLNLCRILYTVIRGEAGSKSKSATWVKETFPQWKTLVESAERWRHGKSMTHRENSIAFIRFSTEQINQSGVLRDSH